MLEKNHFNPLPPYGGRPDNVATYQTMQYISIHSLRMEGDILCYNNNKEGGDISIHSLRMEGDICLGESRTTTQNFNPLPPYGGRQFFQNRVSDFRLISIHSLRMEGDEFLQLDDGEQRDFNPLPPYGGRLIHTFVYCAYVQFQSTPSVWRETTPRTPL